MGDSNILSNTSYDPKEEVYRRRLQSEFLTNFGRCKPCPTKTKPKSGKCFGSTILAFPVIFGVNSSENPRTFGDPPSDVPKCDGGREFYNHGSSADSLEKDILLSMGEIFWGILEQKAFGTPSLYSRNVSKALKTVDGLQTASTTSTSPPPPLHEREECKKMLIEAYKANFPNIFSGRFNPEFACLWRRIHSCKDRSDLYRVLYLQGKGSLVYKNGMTKLTAKPKDVPANGQQQPLPQQQQQQQQRLDKAAKNKQKQKDKEDSLRAMEEEELFGDRDDPSSGRSDCDKLMTDALDKIQLVIYRVFARDSDGPSRGTDHSSSSSSSISEEREDTATTKRTSELARSTKRLDMRASDEEELEEEVESGISDASVHSMDEEGDGEMAEEASSSSSDSTYSRIDYISSSARKSKSKAVEAPSQPSAPPKGSEVPQVGDDLEPAPCAVFSGSMNQLISQVRKSPSAPFGDHSKCKDVFREYYVPNELNLPGSDIPQEFMPYSTKRKPPSPSSSSSKKNASRSQVGYVVLALIADPNWDPKCTLWGMCNHSSKIQSGGNEASGKKGGVGGKFGKSNEGGNNEGIGDGFVKPTYPLISQWMEHDSMISRMNREFWNRKSGLYKKGMKDGKLSKPSVLDSESCSGSGFGSGQDSIYDPKEIFSLEAAIAWLKRKGADTEELRDSCKFFDEESEPGLIVPPPADEMDDEGDDDEDNTYDNSGPRSLFMRELSVTDGETKTVIENLYPDMKFAVADVKSDHAFCLPYSSLKVKRCQGGLRSMMLPWKEDPAMEFLKRHVLGLCGTPNFERTGHFITPCLKTTESGRPVVQPRLLIASKVPGSRSGRVKPKDFPIQQESDSSSAGTTCQVSHVQFLADTGSFHPTHDSRLGFPHEKMVQALVLGDKSEDRPFMGTQLKKSDIFECYDKITAKMDMGPSVLSRGNGVLFLKEKLDPLLNGVLHKEKPSTRSLDASLDVKTRKDPWSLMGAQIFKQQLPASSQNSNSPLSPFARHFSRYCDLVESYSFVACELLKDMLENPSAPSTDGMKAIVKYVKTDMRRTPTDRSMFLGANDSSSSAMGNFLEKAGYSACFEQHIPHGVHHFILVTLAILDSFRPDLGLHFHILHSGPGSVGKSLWCEKALAMCIEGTISNPDFETPRARMTGDHSEGGYYHDEMNSTISGYGSAGKGSAVNDSTVARFKKMLSGAVLVLWTLIWVKMPDGTKARASEIIATMCTGTMITNMNEGKFDSTNAVLSRFYRSMVAKQLSFSDELGQKLSQEAWGECIERILNEVESAAISGMCPLACINRINSRLPSINGKDSPEFFEMEVDSLMSRAVDAKIAAKCPSRSVPEAMMGEDLLGDKNQPLRTTTGTESMMKRTRIVQAWVSLAWKLIHVGALPEVNLIGAHMILQKFFSYLKSKAGLVPETYRSYSRVLIMCRILTVLDACWQVFVVDGCDVPMGTEFSLELLLNLRPYLFCTMKNTILAVTLLSEEYARPYDSLVLKRLGHLSHYFFVESTPESVGINSSRTTVQTPFYLSYNSATPKQFVDLVESITGRSCRVSGGELTLPLLKAYLKLEESRLGKRDPTVDEDNKKGKNPTKWEETEEALLLKLRQGGVRTYLEDLASKVLKDTHRGDPTSDSTTAATAAADKGAGKTGNNNGGPQVPPTGPSNRIVTKPKKTSSAVSQHEDDDLSFSQSDWDVGDISSTRASPRAADKSAVQQPKKVTPTPPTASTVFPSHILNKIGDDAYLDDLLPRLLQGKLYPHEVCLAQSSAALASVRVTWKVKESNSSQTDPQDDNTHGFHGRGDGEDHGDGGMVPRRFDPHARHSTASSSSYSNNFGREHKMIDLNNVSVEGTPCNVAHKIRKSMINFGPSPEDIEHVINKYLPQRTVTPKYSYPKCFTMDEIRSMAGMTAEELVAEGLMVKDVQRQLCTANYVPRSGGKSSHSVDLSVYALEDIMDTREVIMAALRSLIYKGMSPGTYPLGLMQCLDRGKFSHWEVTEEDIAASPNALFEVKTSTFLTARERTMLYYEENSGNSERGNYEDSVKFVSSDIEDRVKQATSSSSSSSNSRRVKLKVPRRITTSTSSTTPTKSKAPTSAGKGKGKEKEKGPDVETSEMETEIPHPDFDDDKRDKEFSEWVESLTEEINMLDVSESGSGSNTTRGVIYTDPVRNSNYLRISVDLDRWVALRHFVSSGVPFGPHSHWKDDQLYWYYRPILPVGNGANRRFTFVEGPFECRQFPTAYNQQLRSLTYLALKDPRLLERRNSFIPWQPFWAFRLEKHLASIIDADEAARSPESVISTPVASQIINSVSSSSVVSTNSSSSSRGRSPAPKRKSPDRGGVTDEEGLGEDIEITAKEWTTNKRHKKGGASSAPQSPSRRHLGEESDEESASTPIPTPSPTWGSIDLGLHSKSTKKGKSAKKVKSKSGRGSLGHDPIDSADLFRGE